MSKQKIGNPSFTQYDGIYVDSVNGDTIANGAQGTPGNPVKTIADAITLAQSKILSKIYLKDVALGAGYALSASLTEGYEFIGDSEYFSIGFDFNSFDSFNSVFRNLTLKGDMVDTDYITASNCTVVTLNLGNGTFNNCEIVSIGLYGFILNHCTFDENDFAVNTIDCSNMNPSGAGELHIDGGTVRISGLITANSIINIFCTGGAMVHIKASCTDGYITVHGDCTILNEGTSKLRDFTNNPKKETAVNITAINASETSVFDLAPVTDIISAVNIYRNFRYTVDKLRLKCADPGVNTVTVRLYELINSVLTQVDSFDITTANYATYFSMMDMFGVNHLSGDNLKITVQTSAGGPYVVTGSYVYRSSGLTTN
jgi:hypothetical protein